MIVKEMIDYLKKFQEDKEILIDGYDVSAEDISRIVYEDSKDSVNINTEMAKIIHNSVQEVFV